MVAVGPPGIVLAWCHSRPRPMAAMDFRTVTAVHWEPRARGSPCPRTPSGAPVTVQTPWFPCTASYVTGMFRLECVVRQDVAIHAEFREWLEWLEDEATTAPELEEWKGETTMSRGVFRDTLRLMAFTDTQVFDDTGAMSADLLDMQTCSCVMTLTGLWRTDTRWGLRWKVTQVKFSRVPMDLPVFEANEESGNTYDFVD